MDVRLTLQQAHLDHPSITALFTFVARDPATQQATKINPVVPQTSEQKHWFEERAAAAKARKAARKAAEAMVASCGGSASKGADAAAGSGDVEKRRAWAQGFLAEARLMSRMPGVLPQCTVEAPVCVRPIRRTACCHFQWCSQGAHGCPCTYVQTPRFAALSYPEGL